MGERDEQMHEHLPAANHSKPKEITMAKLDVAQINYLSQDLIIHIQNVQNLIGQGTFELDRAQKSLKMLLNAQDQWMREIEPASEEL